MILNAFQMPDPNDLEMYLFQELKRRISIPNGFSDELICSNLLYLFSRDDKTAIEWVDFIEQEFGVSLPDNEVDYFFFSSIRTMADKISQSR
jgi:hypothetical protein